MKMVIRIFFLALSLLAVRGQDQATFPKLEKRSDFCGLGNNSCLISRTDVVQCKFLRDSIQMPGPNEFGIYITRFRNGVDGCLQCQILSRDHEVRPVQVINHVMTIFSPGVVDHPPVSYDNDLYVEYNIQCGHGRLAFMRISKMDLEPKTCWDPNQDELRCVDYVRVEREQSGNVESCGDDLSMDYNTFLQRSLKIIFRSSPFDNFPGFMAQIVCFETEDIFNFRGVEINALSNNFALSSWEQRQLDELTAPHFDIARKMARRKRLRPAFSNSAVLRALAFENAFNPVIRAAARSITEDLLQREPGRLAYLRAIFAALVQDFD